MANLLRCSCPSCVSGLTAGGFGCDGATGAVTPGVQTPVSAAKPTWTLTQIADNLTRSNTAWTTTASGVVTVTFRFLETQPASGVEAAGFSAFSNVQRAAARVALQTWADAANIRFVESAAVSAQIVFANTTSGPGQAWAYYPGAGVGGDVWINPNQASNFALSPGGYGMLTLIHEIGHALGLSHPGDYDASQGVPTYAANAKYAQDSRQYSDMSYFSAANTGANHGSSYGSTPLLHDILAIQSSYGANTTVRNTATVYGFNSTAGLSAYNFTVNRAPVVTLIDAGGADTLDLSGYTMAERVDLREGSFSDVGGLTGNLSIAYGTVIESVIGGSAADTITGNDVANRLDGGAGDDVLTGGLGNDTLVGGAGSDTAIYSGSASAYSVIKLGTDIYQVSGADGTDRLEGIEFLRFNAGGGAALAVDTLATGAILSVSAVTSRVMEGNSGSVNAQFIVTRAGNTFSAASAAWAVSGTGSRAASASDFLRGVFASGTVSFAAGETSKTISVAVAGDTVVEEDETFALTLSAPATGTSFSVASAEMTIGNDDIAPAVLSIAADAAAVVEGNSGVTPYSFTVTRGGNTAIAASAGWKVTGAAPYVATAADFAGGVLPAGVVSFAAGETSKTIIINIAADTVVENDEGFSVTLVSPGVNTSLGTLIANGLIRNDDIAPATLAIKAAAASKAEGASGATAYTFTVTRAGNTGLAASADWSVSGSGTNKADASDFAGGVLPGGTVSFAAGETSKTISVMVAGDTVVEGDEGFTVTLAATSGNTTLSTASATGVILNDDIAPAVLSVAGKTLSQAEGNAGSTAFSFIVTRAGNTGIAASARWSLAGSGASAVSAADFQGNALPSGVVNFAAGETSKTVSFNVLGDGVAEANEGFTITLAAVSANTTLGTASVAGAIINDDVSRIGGQVLASGQEVFAAADAAGRQQIWAGTVVSASQLTSGTVGFSQARQFVRLAGGQVAFTANDGAGRSQLFATDGLAVRQISAATNVAGLQPADFTDSVGGRTVFTGLDAGGRSQLWATDGTVVTQLTSLSAGLNARGFSGLADGRDLFLGLDATARLRTWVTDGTSQGTYIVA